MAPPASPAAPRAAASPDATPRADYDPTAAIRDGADPAKVYLAEPRNTVWAAVVENVVGGQLDRDVKHVLPGAGGVRMGCRTLSCLILVDAPADKMELALALVQLVTLGPVTVNLGPSPEGRGQILFLTEPRMADPATFTGWYLRTRRKTLDALHAGLQVTILSDAVGARRPDDEQVMAARAGDLEGAAGEELTANVSQVGALGEVPRCGARQGKRTGRNMGRIVERLHGIAERRHGKDRQAGNDRRLAGVGNRQQDAR